MPGNRRNQGYRKKFRRNGFVSSWCPSLFQAGSVGPCHSSSKSLLLDSTPHLDLGMPVRERGSLFGGLRLLPPGHARDTREAISIATDKLLAEVLGER